MKTLRMGSFLHPAVFAPFLCLAYMFFVVQQFDTPLALVTLGSDFAPAELHDETYSAEGYDGQFVYYLARDGLNAEPFIDIPAYRAQRILLSAIGGLLAFGNEALLPYSLAFVNLLALGISTALLADLVKQHNPRISAWVVIGYTLSMGVFGAARLTTTETLAYGLVIGGIWLIERDRPWFAAIIFALAVLAKETTLFFPAAYGCWLLWERRLRTAFGFGAVVLVPFLIWQAILLQRYGALGIGSGGGGATGFEVIPFWGFIQIILVGGSAGVFLAVLTGGFVVIPTLWAFWRCTADTLVWWRKRRRGESAAGGWSLMTWLLLANVVIMPFVPFSTYREPLGILRFIVGLQIALILYAAERRNRRALLYSTLWFVTTFLVIASDLANAG